MDTTPQWSAKDLEHKWTRNVFEKQQDETAWDLLASMVGSLGETRLDVAALNEAIRTRDAACLARISDNLDPTAYGSPVMLLQDRLVAQLLDKFDFSTSPFDKEEMARIRYFKAEHMCRVTNARFRMFTATGSHAELDDDIRWCLDYARCEIRKLLGRFDPNEMLESARFGPGATLCVKGNGTTEYFKYSNRSPTVSESAFSYAEALLNYDPKWKALLAGIHPLDVAAPFDLSREGLSIDLVVANYEKITFVPKNVKTFRTIGVGPYFNVYFQLGVGGMIRRRLKKSWGIDLSDQTKNQELARLASIADDFATEDFSMASDTVARQAVRYYLDDENDANGWFANLDRLRCRDYLLDGVSSPYEKFSAMGNGFTFELETLLFAALARAVHARLGLRVDEVSVYGDDVILSSLAAPMYNRVCGFSGFLINEQKSFVSGPFRESCGTDYLRGVDVRPVFCKELRTVQHVVSLANRFYALRDSRGAVDDVSRVLDTGRDFLLRKVPRDVRRLVVGPPSDSVDSHIHTRDGAELAFSPLVKWDRDLWCWRYPVISFRSREYQRHNAAMTLVIQSALRRLEKAKPSSALEPARVRLLAGPCLEFNPRKRPHITVRDVSWVHGLVIDEGTSSITRPKGHGGSHTPVTRRETGSWRLGHSLAWSLGTSIHE